MRTPGSCKFAHAVGPPWAKADERSHKLRSPEQAAL